MATYIMFGKITPEITGIISARRTDDATALVRKLGGEIKAGYALMGGVDFVIVLEAPDNPRAMQISVALTRLLGFSFSAVPAVTIAEFDKLMAA